MLRSPFHSLKGKLLFSLACLVLLSCLLVAGTATHRYTASLRSGLASQAEQLALSLALQSTDLILINDLVSLRKLIEQTKSSHPEVAYAFILREDQILTSTFDKGVPLTLIAANPLPPGETGRTQYISESSGEHYLDIVWPILEGKAGTLRLGFSEQTLFKKVRELWQEIALLTGGILGAALLGGLFFIERITKPLGELARATREIDKDRFDVRVEVSGTDEVARLGESFNHMTRRLQNYIHRIETQSADIEQLYSQLSVAYEVIQGASERIELHDIATFLITTIRERITCSKMVLTVYDTTQSALYVMTSGQCTRIPSRDLLVELEARLEGLPPFAVTFAQALPQALVPEFGADAARHGLVPLVNANRRCGCLAIFCPSGCGCNLMEVDFIGLVLAHTTAILMRAVQHEEEIRRLTSRLEAATEYCGIVGRDASMQAVFSLIEDVAPTEATVLILGESGTGKELVAQAIREKSPRREKPFVVINCAAFPETLLESELFGHEKGTFTGAVKQRVGRFEQADGGTVFLDEIGEVPPSAQVKLLRILQTRQFERLGSDKTIDVDVRIIAATNKNLLEEVRAGRFREDLFYRLDVVSLRLPPLRDRGNDITLLARHFLQRYAAGQGKDVHDFDSQADRLLLEYHWPGNVRELENVVEQAVVVAKSRRIHPTDLPEKLRRGGGTPRRTMQEQEKALLLETLRECGWNRTLAAERLGIGRSTLYAKLRKFHIQLP